MKFFESADAGDNADAQKDQNQGDADSKGHQACQNTDTEEEGENQNRQINELHDVLSFPSDGASFQRAELITDSGGIATGLGQSVIHAFNFFIQISVFNLHR